MTAKESIEVQEEPEGEPAEPEQEACATISFFTAARYPEHSAGVISLRALACLMGFLNGNMLSSYVLSQIN